MAHEGATGADEKPNVTGNMVLVVGSDGSVCSVLEAPRQADGAEVDGLRTSGIAALWPDDIAHRIRQNIARTVRSRQCFRDEIEDPSEGRVCEFIFVAQGRDRALMIVRDLSAHDVKLSRIQKLAFTDKVTGLPNREFLFGELQKITELQQLKEGRAAMICVHVDQLDDHGYTLSPSQQDDVLREVANRLKKQLRGTNEPFEDDLERLSMVARTDFRQFGIVLPSIVSGDDAEAVTGRLLSSLTRPISVGARTIEARVRGGIALFPQDGTDAETLFENAVTALEDARNSQSEPFKMHSGTVRLRTLQRQDLEVELRSALEREEYSLNFLPVVRADSYAPVSMEALLRWPETILGSHSTRKVVSIAERTGLILPIGEWVLRHAGEQLQKWRAEGHSDLRLAVNLSAQEFSRSDLAPRIERLLDDAGLAPEDIDLEIKEHMLFRDAISGFAACADLKRLGVRILVDDYGTGACSLAHFSQSPVDGIKIDPIFVSNIETSDRDRAASSAAIAVADRLGLEVIAEGVETESQAQLLREQGCSHLQGYLFTEPLHDADVLEYLNQAVDEPIAKRSRR